MENKTIYNIEDRGYSIIAHWFFFMLAGLIDIIKGKLIDSEDADK